MLIVIFNHFEIPGFSRGWIGVDVFFVISGYVISIQLLEMRLKMKNTSFHSSKRYFQEFYVRRFFRLMPAAIVTISITVVASRIFLSTSRANEILKDAYFSLALTSNFRYMSTSTDYFFQNSIPSPLLHFWSLSVEEQFYLIFPFLFLILTLRIQGKNHLKSTRVLLVGTSLMIAVSLLFSIFLKDLTSSYYNPITRFHQLLLGVVAGIIATAYSRSLNKFVRTTLIIYGSSTLVLSMIAINGNDYPGFKGLIPATSTVALILSIPQILQKKETNTSVISRVLTIIGNMSYSLYLVHFPILFFTKIFFAEFDTSGSVKIISLSVVFLLSMFLHLSIEQPIHQFGRNLCRVSFNSPVSSKIVIKDLYRKILLGIMGFSLLFLTAIMVPTSQGSSTKPLLSYTESGSDFKYPYDESLLRQEFSLDVWQQGIRNGNLLRRIPRSIDISAGEIWSGRKRQWEKCMDAPDEQVTCSFGNQNAAKSVVLLGDSYAFSLLPMLLNTFDLDKWKIVALNERECMISSVTPLLDSGESFTECDKHRDWTFDFLKRNKPDLAIISDQPFHPILSDKSDSTTSKVSIWERAVSNISVWEKGLNLSLKKIADAVPNFIYVGVPSNAAAIPDCTLANGDYLPNCFSESAKWAQYRMTQRALTSLYGGQFFDVTEYHCIDGVCPPVIDNSPVFWDGVHFSETFSMKMAHPFREFLSRMKP